MCPDRQIISLYFDMELPSPWKEKMEAHLKSCPKCQAELARYRQLGESLKDLNEESIQAASQRVWKKLGTTEFVSESIVYKKYNNALYGNRKGLWRKSINLPLPVAVAALLAIVFSLVFTFMRSGNTTNDAVAIMPEQLNPIAQEWSSTVMGDDLATFFPAMDMEFLLQQIINQNEGDFVIVRLPENRRFSRAGQPTLINAADYSRSRAHR